MTDAAWHAQSVAQTLTKLETSPAGLDEAEAAARRTRYGLNALASHRPDPAWKIFLHQFKNPLIYLLVAAAGVSLILGGTRDAIIIASILLFNAIIGFSQERQAAQAMSALRQMTRDTCHVIRQGEEQEIAVQDVVPGDVIVLEAGDIMPADGRVIESNNVKVNESILSGESASTEKHTEPLSNDTGISDRKNCVFRGTTIVAGRGLAVVTAIGMLTEYGRIVGTVQHIRHDETPLQRRFAVFARMVGISVVSFVVVLFALGIIRGESVTSMAMVAISLAVAVIPEGLPIVVTLTLALGTRQMARKKAIVRKLSAVETLGSVDIIAADKTGTLTYGEMMVQDIHTLRSHFQVSGEGYKISGEITRDGRAVSLVDEPALERAILVGALCNDAKLSHKDGAVQPIGDPTEISLLILAEKSGMKVAGLNETHPRIGEFPFDFSARYMVTFHTQGERELVAVKGAPESMLDLCGTVADGNKNVSMTPQLRNTLAAQADQLAEQGLRGLVIATTESKALRPGGRSTLIGQLTYLALVGIQDTVRPEAKDTVARCHDAGIRVVMVTGDYRKTAEHVARELGLIITSEKDALIDGAELDRLDDTALVKRLPAIRVAARATPLQKLRLVRTFKAQNHVVAVTGDGVNDAPALVEANIGIAVDRRATDAAKEAADILLTDGNLATIVDAVEVGRGIFQNVRRVVLYLFSTNVAEALIIFATLLTGLPLPFLPIQILWLNVVSDTFLDVAIATEPVHVSVMNQPPRQLKEGIFNWPMTLRLMFISLLVTVGALWYLKNIANNAASENLRYALGFTGLLVFQWFNALNVLSEHKSILSRMLGTNKWFVSALGVVMSLHAVIVYVPSLNKIFRFAPLSVQQIIVIILVGSVALWAEELRKLVLRSRTVHS